MMAVSSAYQLSLVLADAIPKWKPAIGVRAAIRVSSTVQNAYIPATLVVGSCRPLCH
jgi:hypothetical protein